MDFCRLSRSRKFIISLLIGLSLLTVLSIGKTLKGRHGLGLRKRDGSRLSFDLPWPFVPNDKPELKAVSPLVGSLLNDVGNVASAILDSGTDVASNVVSQTAGLLPVPSALPVIEVAQAASILADVNKAVAQATSVVAMLVADATSAVGSLLAEATNAPNIGVLSSNTAVAVANSNPNLTAAPTPQGFLPQTGLSAASGNGAPSITSAVVLNPFQSLSNPTGYSYPTAIAKPSPCPVLATVTCTVTETWHSTHYAQTATVFIAPVTFTCTETVSVCPALPAYLAPPVYMGASALNDGPLVACAPGLFAKRAEDCPSSKSNSAPGAYNMGIAPISNPCPNTGYSCSECPGGFFCPPSAMGQAVPCGYGWPCSCCSTGYYCVPNPLGAAASAIGAGEDGDGASGGSTAPPSQGAVQSGPLTSGNAAGIGSGNGVETSPSATSLSSIQLSPSSAIGNTAAGSLTSNAVASSVVQSAVANVASALGEVSGLTGALLGTVLADVSSVLIAAGNGIAKAQTTPTSGLEILGAQVTSTLGTNIVPLETSLAGILPGPANGLPSVPNIGNLLSVTTAVGGLPTVAGGTAAPPVIAGAGNIVSQVLATINGQATALPVVDTVLNGVSTIVPAIPQVVGGVATLIPVVAGGVSQVIGGTGGTSGLIGGVGQVIGAGGLTQGIGGTSGLTGGIGQAIGAGGLTNGLGQTIGAGGLTQGTGGVTQALGQGGLADLTGSLFGGLGFRVRRRGTPRQGSSVESDTSMEEAELFHGGGLKV